MASLGASILDETQEEAQSATGDILQICAVEDDVFAFAVLEHSHIFLGLRRGCSVESTFEGHH